MQEPLEKNQVLEAVIQGCTSEGQGVARIDGRAVFVKGALPGERCRIRILKAGKAAVYARVEELLASSPFRIMPDCTFFGKCGGCDFRHVAYEEELRLKLQRLNDALRRIGGLELEAEAILPAPETDRYRDKAIYTISEDRNGMPVTGFYRARTHEVIPVEDCLLQKPEANRAAAVLRQWMKLNKIPAYDEKTGKGLLRHLFVRNGMVCVVASGEPRFSDQLIHMLCRELPEMKSLVWNVNRSRGNTVLAGEFHTLWGEDRVEIRLSGLRFSLSPRSFFQVNPPQAERLYAKALELAGLTGKEKVVDLYCGTGAIGLLAARRAAEVVGVELVPAAVEDAIETARDNDVRNITFVCVDAEEAAARFAAEGRKPDVLFVDPPRKGLAPGVIGSIATMSPRRVVYISCDPATLARDLKLFGEQDYHAEKAVAVDMFPRTSHVESVVKLTRAGL